jgi:hypothetical protein
MFDLTEILSNRAWLRRTCPFPHVVASNVFTDGFYNSIAVQLKRILDCGLYETPLPGRFSRSIPNYDSYGLALDHCDKTPISVFLSPKWRGMVNSLFGIGVTPYVFAGAHYHAIGSKSGLIHNDYNPVWFPRFIGEGIQIPKETICSYKTGLGSLDESEKVQVVRGAVVLFYLLNDGWRPGDGGETGLYTSPGCPVSHAAALCPPINNSLVAFECTPSSYHTFLANQRLARTSIIMWTHRTLEEANRKFGAGNLIQWTE